MTSVTLVPLGLRDIMPDDVEPGKLEHLRRLGRGSEGEVVLMQDAHLAFFVLNQLYRVGECF